LEEPFNHVFEFLEQIPNLGPQPQTTPTQTAKTVFVESINRTDVSKIDYEIMGTQNPQGGVQTQLLFRAQKWETE